MRENRRILQYGLMSALLVALLAPGAAATFCQKMFIPAYFYPGALWNQAIAGAPIVDVMVMNPNSGPGTSQNSDYVTAVQNARNAGIKVLGYVHTTYSQRSAATVKMEMDNYTQWYNVSGFFIDETNSSAAAIPYYADLRNYSQQILPGAYMSLNPGTAPNPGYANISDNLVIFEGTYNTYKTWTAPSWVNSFAASKFTHLVHATTTQSNMKKAVDRAHLTTRGGKVYVTNDVLPNPWDTLPSYWSAELTRINSSC